MPKWPGQEMTLRAPRLLRAEPPDSIWFYFFEKKYCCEVGAIQIPKPRPAPASLSQPVLQEDWGFCEESEWDVSSPKQQEIENDLNPLLSHSVC